MLFWVLVLPFKLGFFLLKSVFALIVIVPLALISLCVATAVLPAIAFAIALPLLLFVGGVVVLVKAFA
jgi:hypothetical protein